MRVCQFRHIRTTELRLFNYTTSSDICNTFLQISQINCGQHISRVLYLTIIYLDLMLPPGSSDLPTGQRRAAVFYALSWSCSGWGLQSCLCYQRHGSLLHCLSTITRKFLAVYFCCTFLGVTSTRRYLASCPMEPGLSSPAAFRQLQPRSSASLNIIQFTIFVNYFINMASPKEKNL